MKLYHMSGAGNTFLLVDARNRTLDFEAMAKTLCARYGADGFLALDLPNKRIMDQHDHGGRLLQDFNQKADFRLHFYNPDGLRGEQCGNGIRCAGHLARLLGIAGDTMDIETDAGHARAEYLQDNLYKIKLPLPDRFFTKPRPDCQYIELGEPGVPHCLVNVPDLNYSNKEKLRELALEFRHDPVFPKGVNVNFYRKISPNRSRILTFERGVEDFTMSCGTGSASLALLYWFQKKLPWNRKLEVENPGGVLTVDIDANLLLRGLFLTGPVEQLAEYEYTP